MKKKKITIALAVSVMALTACSGGQNRIQETTKQETAQEPQTEAETGETTTTQAEESVTESVAEHNGKIEPLPGTLDLNRLYDCQFAAEFHEGDAVLDDYGITIHLTVYDYEKFDMADIANMQPGDTLVIDGQEMEVKTVEQNENGSITVNGGLEEGGCDLFTDEDGFYYEAIMDVGKSYYEIGEVTLPVNAEEFILNDDSDPSNQGQVFNAKDLLYNLNDLGVSTNFYPDSTQVTMKNGEIVQIDRIFMP